MYSHCDDINSERQRDRRRMAADFMAHSHGNYSCVGLRVSRSKTGIVPMSSCSGSFDALLKVYRWTAISRFLRLNQTHSFGYAGQSVRTVLHLKRPLLHTFSMATGTSQLEPCTLCTLTCMITTTFTFKPFIIVCTMRLMSYAKLKRKQYTVPTARENTDQALGSSFLSM